VLIVPFSWGSQLNGHLHAITLHPPPHPHLDPWRTRHQCCYRQHVVSHSWQLVSFFSATRPTGPGPGAPQQGAAGIVARVWQGSENIGVHERQLPKLAHLELCTHLRLHARVRGHHARHVPGPARLLPQVPQPHRCSCASAPIQTRCRLGGLVIEASVADSSSSNSSKIESRPLDFSELGEAEARLRAALLDSPQ
jgi:hypothetical protein